MEQLVDVFPNGSTRVVTGDIVRVTSAKTLEKSRADISARLEGTVGVVSSGDAAPGAAAVGVTTSGRQLVRLEPALAPFAGQTLWVSATVAGCATNVMPAIALPVGTIKNADEYTRTGRVLAEVESGGVISTGDAVVVLNVVSSLRGYSATPSTATLYRTRNYAVPGDGGGAFYLWDAASTEVDDGALTIGISGVAVGRFKYQDNGSKIFPLQSSAIDRTGTFYVSVELASLLATLVENGYRGLDCDYGILRLNQPGVPMPPRPETVGFSVLNAKFTSDNLNGPFGPSIRADVGTEIPILNGGYGTRTWDGAVVAGQRTFNDVADIVGLAVGDSVIVCVGADPSNIGGAYTFQWAKIEALTPTVGAAGNVTIDRPITRDPIVCNGVVGPGAIPTWNNNVQRPGGSTRHDLIKVTPIPGETEAFQDNLQFVNCTFDNCYLHLSLARDPQVLQPFVNQSYFCFRFDVCTYVKIVDPVIRRLTGGWTGGGYPDNFGTIFTNYGSIGSEVHNFRCDDMQANGAVWNEELTSGDGVHFTGNTRVNFDNTTDPGVHSGWVVGSRLVQSIQIDRLIASGAGNVHNERDVSITNLNVEGQVNVLAESLARVSALRWMNEEWNIVKRTVQPVVGMAPSSSIDFVIPQHGIIRSFRIFASSLVGITDVLLVREDTATLSILTVLQEASAGEWADVARFLTDMDFSFQTFGGQTRAIRVVTDGSFVDGTYLLYDIDTLTASRRLIDDVFVDTSLPSIIAGSGPPAVSAQFVGQVYRDVPGKRLYDALSAGTGAGDWVIR